MIGGDFSWIPTAQAGGMEGIPEWANLPTWSLQILGGLFATTWILTTLYQRVRQVLREEAAKDAELENKLREMRRKRSGQ